MKPCRISVCRAVEQAIAGDTDDWDRIMDPFANFDSLEDAVLFAKERSKPQNTGLVYVAIDSVAITSYFRGVESVLKSGQPLRGKSL